MVLPALLHAKGSDPVRQAGVGKRALNWLPGMQSRCSIVLESLCRRGLTTEHTAVQRGVQYLLTTGLRFTPGPF